MKAIEVSRGKFRDMVCNGKVTAIKGQQYTVHVYDPSAQHKCYLPNWENGSKDKSQKKQPRGYTAETHTVAHRDVEYATALTDTYRIPMQAWRALQAKGVVLPYEYAQERCCVEPQTQAAAAASVTCSAIRTQRDRSNAARRPNRRQQLTLQPGSEDHKWIMYMLKQHGLTVSNDVLYDHGRLMHYVQHGATTMPSGAMMDEDYASMLRTGGGPDEGNMVPQLRRHFDGQNLYDPDQPEDHGTDMWQMDTHADAQHEYDMITPTAPEWSSDEEAPTREVEGQPEMV